MKKLYAILAAAGLVLVGLFGAQPANAVGGTGSWSPKGSSFTVPSNWSCGPTSQSNSVYWQACVVRSGNYVQAATIVNNRSNAQVIVGIDQTLTPSSGASLFTHVKCAFSGVAAKSISVCFTPTSQSSLLVRNAAAYQWGDIYDFSPWA